MSKKLPPSIHPRSYVGQLNRRWQTKYGELCQTLHEIRKCKELVEAKDTPSSFREPAAEEVERLYPVLGKLALEAGPKAFAECWRKSGDIMAMIKGRSFQARVLEAAEDAWVEVSPLKVEMAKNGQAVIYPREPADFNKAGLKRRTLALLVKDPAMKRILDEPHGEEVFDKAFRRALRDLRLEVLPKAKPGPRKQQPKNRR